MRIVLIVLITVLGSCSQLKKKEEVGDVLPLAQVPPSFMSFRVNFPAEELQAGLNRILPKEILNDAIPLSDSRDTLFLTLIRKGDVRLKINGGVVEASIPLDVSVAIKKKVLGVTFSNEDTPVQLSGTVRTTSDIQLRDNWELDILCKWEGFDWSDQPKITLAGFSIDIGRTVEGFLEDQSDLLSDIICNAIHESISFRETITTIWDTAQDPIRIRTNNRPLWLHSRPTGLAGQVIRMKDMLSLNMEYRTVVSITHQQVIGTPRNTLPNRTASLNNRSDFLAYPELLISYSMLEETIKQELSNQEITYQGYSTSVKELSVGPRGQLLEINLTLEGDIQGVLSITGRPYLNDQMELSLENFNYEMKSEEPLMAFTDLLLHSLVEEYIGSFLGWDASFVLGKVDDAITNGITDTPLGQKMGVRIAFNKINSYQLTMTEFGIQWILSIEGNSVLSLKRGLFSPS